MFNTAMQELINWANECLTDKYMSETGRIALEITIVRATDLLEKEKEQIKDAYKAGNWDGGLQEYHYDPERFYNKVYNEKIPDNI